ncbi:MAG: hypothetical protein ACUVQK_06840 [Thermogutta sp.]
MNARDEAPGESGVHVTFDCVPLRTVTRNNPPLDASPGFLALWNRVQTAIAKHGRHNTYYLFHGQCTYHLTNQPNVGILAFAFEGCVMTDPADRRTAACDLEVRLTGDTCDWATEPIIRWFSETVRRSVMAEFDRYIEAGDLQRTVERLQRLEAETHSKGGHVGFGL